MVGIEMVDEAMLLCEAEKEPKRVLSFINDSKTRWFSTFATVGTLLQAVS